jgi:hypothetical protein
MTKGAAVFGALHLPEDMGFWVSDLIAKGYKLPEAR